jgi:uncharacterized membrane protein
MVACGTSGLLGGRLGVESVVFCKLGVACRVAVFTLVVRGFRVVAFFATGFLVTALAAVFFGLAMILSLLALFY